MHWIIDLSLKKIIFFYGIYVRQTNSSVYRKNVKRMNEWRGGVKEKVY